MEKVVKESIIVIAQNILKDISERTFNNRTISVSEKKIKLFPIKEGYYEQEGWVFTVEGEEVGCVMYFLAYGTPVRVSFPSGDDNSATLYIIKNEDNKYEYVSEEDYYIYHNFNFEKDFERREFEF